MKTIILCVSLLMVGCAGNPAVNDESAKDDAADAHGNAKVVGHHCDGGQGVDGLLLNVEKTGPVIIRWNNEGICGKAA